MNCEAGESGRRKLWRSPRAKIKDVIQARDPVLKPVVLLSGKELNHGEL